MKKLQNIILIIITVLSVGTYFFLKHNQSVKPTINQLDSRAHMTRADFASPTILNSSPIAPSTTALANLKKNLPVTNVQFSISWDNQTNTAVGTISQPYDANLGALISWLGTHQANDLPFGVLKVTKK